MKNWQVLTFCLFKKLYTVKKNGEQLAHAPLPPVPPVMDFRLYSYKMLYLQSVFTFVYFLPQLMLSKGGDYALCLIAGRTQTGHICMQTVEFAALLGSPTYITVVDLQKRAHKRRCVKCKDFEVGSFWVWEVAHSEQGLGARPPGFKHQLYTTYCVTRGKSPCLCLFPLL